MVIVTGGQTGEAANDARTAATMNYLAKAQAASFGGAGADTFHAGARRPGGQPMSTPNPNACRWCDIDKDVHLQRWAPVVDWHEWTPPTDEQRKKRLQDRAAERQAR